MKQRESVYNAVIEVMGSTEGVVTPTKEQRAEIITMVAESLHQGETDFSESAKAKYHTIEKVRTYTAGLVSNWLRKDSNLNGGVKYVPKNPGSRTGSQDPQVKACRQLLKIKTDPSEVEAIQEALDARLSELAIAKAKDVEIDISALPAHLVEELGLE